MLAVVVLAMVGQASEPVATSGSNPVVVGVGVLIVTAIIVFVVARRNRRTE